MTEAEFVHAVNEGEAGGWSSRVQNEKRLRMTGKGSE
jgi:hypothetical protein